MGIDCGGPISDDDFLRELGFTRSALIDMAERCAGRLEAIGRDFGDLLDESHWELIEEIETVIAKAKGLNSAS